MCELMTIAASVAFTVAYFAAKRRGAPTRALFTTMLMFYRPGAPEPAKRR